MERTDRSKTEQSPMLSREAPAPAQAAAGAMSERVAPYLVVPAFPQGVEATVSDSVSLWRRLTGAFVLGTAFFASWGSGLQTVTRFDLSKLFVGLAALTIFAWLVSVRSLTGRFPKAFTWFLLFFVFHTLIAYGLFRPGDFTIGYTGEAILEGGVLQLKEGTGLTAARFLLFALYGCALVGLSGVRWRLQAFQSAYCLGIIAVIAMGGYAASASYAGQEEHRLAGGALNPNAFGLDVMLALLFAVSMLIGGAARSWQKAMAALTILMGCPALLASGSRSALAGLVLGLVVLFSLAPGVRRRVLIACAVLLLTLSAMMLVPNDVADMARERLSIARIIEDRGAGRLDIWAEYLHDLDQYAWFGVGIGGELRVSWSGRAPHNTYLSVLVAFGAGGLVLFLAGLWQMGRGLYGRWRANQDIMTATIASIFIVCLALFCLGDRLSARSTWIVLALAAVGASGRAEPPTVAGGAGESGCEIS